MKRKTAGLTAALLSLLKFLGLRNMIRQDREELDIVRMPKILLYAGLCFVILWLSAAVHILRTGSGELVLLSVLPGLLAAGYLLGYARLRITFDEQQFTVWRYGLRRRYRFDRLRGIIPGQDGAYRLVTDRDVIPVDAAALNGDVFLRYAQRRWAVYSGCTSLPILPEP